VSLEETEPVHRLLAPLLRLPVSRPLRNDIPRSSSRISDIAVPPRNHVNVRVFDGLSCCDAVVNRDVKPIQLVAL